MDEGRQISRLLSERKPKDDDGWVGAYPRAGEGRILFIF